MNQDTLNAPPPGRGSWRDAEELRKWSFLRRTPQQRLDWLVDALTIRHLAGKLSETLRKDEPARTPKIDE
jgi:hypothetical protein